MTFDRSAVADVLAAEGSIAGAARALGVERRRLSEFINGDEELRALKRHPERAGSVTIRGDDAEATLDAASLGDMDAHIRSRGLDPDEWVAHTAKFWETYHGDPRVTLTLRRRVAMALLSPAVHVPAIVVGPPVERPAGEPDLIVVEGDHQAPYHDPGLDACATAFVRDLQPVEHVFLGDTADFPTISRHPDHPAAMATAQECVDAAYGILRRRAEAAPNAKRFKLKGNHDWRVESELLGRAERMHPLSPAGEDVPVWSLRRLLHLDALGVELVEDSRGWEHAEVVLIPGENGLVVRHGFVTGANTADRTVRKLGRSAIVGHGHQKEHHWHLAYPGKYLQQGVVAGTMSRCDEVFPHFAVNPNWHQGFVTVERWPNGYAVVEHATYHDGTLYWRDRRWSA